MTLIVPKPVRGQNLAVQIKRPGERRSLSRSATRALDVLELFGRERRPLRGIEIAEALRTQPSSTNQLLKTMVDSAHLTFDGRTKAYLPSARLAAFSEWLWQGYGSDNDVQALLKEVQVRTGMIVTISTASDLFMQLIDLAGPPGGGGERGMRVSIFGSAIGSAYLAMLEDAEVVRLAGRARIPDAQLPEILENAARIRDEGFAAGPGSDTGHWSIAVPLPSQGLRAASVLGLAGKPDLVQARVAELAGIMRECIQRRLDAA